MAVLPLPHTHTHSPECLTSRARYSTPTTSSLQPSPVLPDPVPLENLAPQSQPVGLCQGQQERGENYSSPQVRTQGKMPVANLAPAPTSFPNS